MCREDNNNYGVWTNLKHGLQVGAGFFIGYFVMRFLTIIAMIVVGFMVTCWVCVPMYGKVENKIIAPAEKAAGITNEQRVWPKGCLVREKPHSGAKVIGQVYPGRKYYVMRKKGHWIKVGGFVVKGWVGCKGYNPAKEAPR